MWMTTSEERTRDEAVKLQEEMHSLFNGGGFLLRKWNCSDPSVLKNIPPDLRDYQATTVLSDSDQYTKTLGIEWDASSDRFRVNVSELSPVECMTKRSLISEVAKTFDAIGWFLPTIVSAKILLQTLWLEKVGWDDLVPESILQQWSRWRQELPMLSNHHIARCYYPKSVMIASTQLHGFSDASEKAYSGVVYLRMEDTNGIVHTSLVTSKTRVAPIKALTIPRLELNGALILAQLLFHCKEVLGIPLSSVYAWTDSTIVLAWLQGNPRHFKVYVANRIAQIMDLIPANHWSHVVSEENHADCVSRGVFPSQLLHHDLWWQGPIWMKSPPSCWPKNGASSSVAPDIVFEHVGLDYGGPLYLKRRSVRKPTILKSYVCVFVSMSVKAVHLELVSDLTTEALIACLKGSLPEEENRRQYGVTIAATLSVPIAS